jgi:catechol 2,3-dioxygenase-like lactoylglutathione lyase family enzyme|tara:strand:- start:22397 stop:23362 length:966 start_codon:yes stop_codon:yes gene_type:complete
MSSSWELSHPGVFVSNFYKTLDYYQSLGIAVHVRRRAAASTGETKQVMTIFGEPVPPAPPQDPAKPRDSGLELLYIGNLELEVLRAPAQRPEGQALAYGEGINHVCFNVPDIDGETDKLVEQGLEIIFDLTIDGVRFEDYLDTREFGNVILSMRPPQSEGAIKWKAGLGIVDWRFRGHGVVVSDLDKSAEYYDSMGFADVQPEALFDSSSIDDVTVYGADAGTAIKARTRAAQIGPVAFEFIEPVEGDAIYRESLDRRGEGIIDLIFSVTDLQTEVAKMDDRGVDVIFSGKPQTGDPFAYLDTRLDGGDIMIKLVEDGAAG